MGKKFFLSAVALVALAGWLVWRRAVQPPIQSGACAGCNLLLVTIDTLRTDRVGAFGGPANLTPTLDRLAAGGLVLTRAYASAPLTLPSHTSMLTAVSPPVHGVRTNGLFRLGPKLPTLATVLKNAGYRTGAFVGAFVLDARFGLTRGFDVYDDRHGEKHAGDPAEGAERRAEDVIKPALAWINSSISQPPATSNQPPAPGSRGSTSTTPTSRIARPNRSPRGISRTTRRSPTPTRQSVRCSTVCGPPASSIARSSSSPPITARASASMANGRTASSCTT